MSDLFIRPLFTWRSAVASKHGPSNPTTRHVLLTLGLHMSDKGDSCFPSTRLLAEETGLSHKSVITHLQLAAGDGWLGKREVRLSNTQGWRRIEYFAVIPPHVEALHMEQRGVARSPRQGDERGSPPAQEVGERGERHSKGGVTDAQRGESDDSLHMYGSTSKSTSRVPRKRSARSPKTALPPNFNVSDRVKAWAAEQGHDRLNEHLAAFLLKVEKHDYRYVNWDSAFMEAIRENWAELPMAKAAPQDWWVTSEGVKAKAAALGIEGNNTEWLKCAIAAMTPGDKWPWIDPRNGTQERLIEEYRAEHAAKEKAA